MNELVTFTTYEAMVAAFRARRIEIGMSQLAVDQAAGLPDGYTSKVEMSIMNPNARNARAIGRESMPLLLGAVGLELAAHRSTAKRGGNASSANGIVLNVSKKMAERGEKGGRVRWARMTDRQRTAHIRKMNLARAERRRKEKAATKRSRCAVRPPPEAAKL